MKVIHLNSNENSEQETLESVQTQFYFRWIVRLGLLLIVTLGFWYLILLNSLATSAFALESLKSERISIQQELEKWEIELAIPTSLYALESSEQVQQMEEIADKTFLEVKDEQMAFVETES